MWGAFTGRYALFHLLGTRSGGAHGRSAKAPGESRRAEEAQGQRSGHPVARHAQPGRLGGLHREWDEVEAADPRRSHLRAPGQTAPGPHRAPAQAGSREAREGLIPVSAGRAASARPAAPSAFPTRS